jgi:hypothetical protein
MTIIPVGLVTIEEDGGRHVYHCYTDGETRTARLLINATQPIALQISKLERQLEELRKDALPIAQAYAKIGQR